MKAPLALRVDDGTQHKDVTREAKGFQFTKTAIGGFHSASVRLNVSRSQFPNLGPADELVCSDARTGRVIFQAMTEVPGTDTDGNGFDLSAIGTQVVAEDQSEAHLWVNQELGEWQQVVAGTNGAVSSSASASDDPGEVLGEGILCQFPPGQPIGADSGAQIGYTFPDGLTVGSIRLITKSGKTDVDYKTDLRYSAGPGTSVGIPIGDATAMSTETITNTRWVGEPSHIPEDQTAVALVLRRSGGATNIADDNTWSLFAGVHLCAQRYDRFGNPILGAANIVSAEYVLAHWVVEDLLGRVLKQCDALAAEIDQSATFQMDQLAYTDGATAGQVLTDLLELEPDFLWQIRERNSRGLVFEWRKWPTEPRYVVSTKDNYELVGSESDLCNRQMVYWTDPDGTARTLTVLAYKDDPAGTGRLVVPEVEALGDRVKDAEAINLPDGRGSVAMAERVGREALVAKAAPSAAARVTVTDYILDLDTGGMVPPWLIEPGYLVLVTETGDVLRLTEMTYDDDSVSATLSLGDPTPTQEQRMARLEAAR